MVDIKGKISIVPDTVSTVTCTFLVDNKLVFEITKLFLKCLISRKEISLTLRIKND